MNAPKKIYLQVCGDCEESECQSCKFEDLEDNVTWSRDPIFKKDIEYTRTDAFIEKAENFFTEKFNVEDYNDIIDVDGSPIFNYGRFIDDFVKFMKGG